MATQTAQWRVKIGDPLPFTVDDNKGIEKGELGKLVDPRTFSGATVGVAGILNNATGFAGIAAREKVANSGRTELAVWRSGWFDIKCSGAATAGDLAGLSDDGYVKKWMSGSAVVGTFLEDATDDERVLVDLNPSADQRQQ